MPTNWPRKPLLLLLQLLLQRTHHLAVVTQVVAKGVVALLVDKYVRGDARDAKLILGEESPLVIIHAIMDALDVGNGLSIYI